MPAMQEQTVLRLGTLCAMVVLLLITLILAHRFLPLKTTPNAPLADKESILFHFDTINFNDLRVRISGWAMHKGTSVRAFDTQVLLKAANGMLYTIPSEMVARPDITASFNDGNKYDASGFMAYGLSPVFFAKGPFTIYLLYKNNKANILVDTGVTL